VIAGSPRLQRQQDSLARLLARRAAETTILDGAGGVAAVIEAAVERAAWRLARLLGVS
jgi:hypothetical protein